MNVHSTDTALSAALPSQDSGVALIAKLGIGAVSPVAAIMATF